MSPASGWDVDESIKSSKNKRAGTHIRAEAGTADVEGYGGEGQCDTQHAICLFAATNCNTFLKKYGRKKHQTYLKTTRYICS